jgi:hypothetical protein
VATSSQVEVTKMEGKEDFILTGQLGDVMKESARAGMSWIRAHAKEFGIDRSVFEKTPSTSTCRRGHPEGRPERRRHDGHRHGEPADRHPGARDVAMTGEITLRGRVLPIGGLKSKILAAHLAGVKMVLLPKRNEKDLVDVPEEVRKQIKLVPWRTWTRCSRRCAPRSAARIKAEREASEARRPTPATRAQAEGRRPRSRVRRPLDEQPPAGAGADGVPLGERAPMPAGPPDPLSGVAGDDSSVWGAPATGW